MQNVEFYLGNDTGVMHMAVAAGIRCLAIFSATNAPGLWEPYGSGHVVLRKYVECEGCLLRYCHLHNTECLRMIETNQVVNAAENLLY